MKIWRLQKISSTGKLYCLWDTYFFKSSYLFQLNISEWKLITKALVKSIDHCPLCNKYFATRLFQVYLPLRKCYYLNKLIIYSQLYSGWTLVSLLNTLCMGQLGNFHQNHWVINFHALCNCLCPFILPDKSRKL